MRTSVRRTGRGQWYFLTTCAGTALVLSGPLLPDSANASWFRCRAEAQFREVGAGTETPNTETPPTTGTNGGFVICPELEIVTRKDDTCRFNLAGAQS
jgi:hypothetical protein